MARRACVADTSMWISLVKFYPVSVFPTLVGRCEDMIRDGRMFSSRLVLDEICRGNDEVVEWAGRHKRAFVRDTDSTVAHAKRIVGSHPHLAGPRDGPERADPYLIALALSVKEGIDGPVPVIVTEENRKGGKKIPKVAQGYGIESCSTVGMLEMEGMVF